MPFLDMIDITCEAAIRCVTKAMVSTTEAAAQSAVVFVGLLGTDATLRLGLYQESLTRAALQLAGDAVRLRVLTPADDSIGLLQQCIIDIKAGVLDHAGIGVRIESEAGKLVATAQKALPAHGSASGGDVQSPLPMCIITGCTELPVCFSTETHPYFAVPIVSPLTTLAQAVVARGRVGAPSQPGACD